MENHFSQNTAAANKSVQKDPRKEDCHNNYSHRGKGASKKMVEAEGGVQLPKETDEVVFQH